MGTKIKRGFLLLLTSIFLLTFTSCGSEEDIEIKQTPSRSNIVEEIKESYINKALPTETTTTEKISSTNPLQKYDHELILLDHTESEDQMSYVVKTDKSDISGYDAEIFRDFITDVVCTSVSDNQRISFVSFLFPDGTGLQFDANYEENPCIYGKSDDSGRVPKGDEYAYFDITNDIRFYSDEEKTNQIFEGSTFDSSWYESIESEVKSEPVYSEQPEPEPVPVQTEAVQNYDGNRSIVMDPPAVEVNPSYKEPVHVDVPAVGNPDGDVWVPVHGGKKYHRNSGCSNMKDPVLMTREEAEASGFTPCKRCYN